MAPTNNTLTWTTFYARNREDEGAIQDHFDKELSEFMDRRTVSHFENPEKLSQTIGGSAFANVVLVPGAPGRMTLLHHGFTCTTDDGFALIFIQGNLSDCSYYFKVLPRDEATAQIKGGNGRNGTINCPTLASMREATTADGFAALVTQGNDILRQKPNHIVVPPTIFLLANGENDVRSKDLAIGILDAIRIDPEDDDEEEVERKEKEAEGMELLLSMLWASENDGLTPVALTDVKGNLALNQMIRTIKAKLGGNPIRNEGREEPEETTGEAAAWAISSQSIVRELNRMHEARESEKSLKESSKSLLKTMGQDERELFTTLSTVDMTVEPSMSEFMVTLTTAGTPQKAIGLLKAASRSWEGTFSEGCCHKFLSAGFLSQESNLANPGGFTVFMFHPKSVDMGTKGFDRTTASLREYFDMDVEDSTIAYYAKQGFFHPKTPDDLRIQLQTAHDMLELITCKGSIATKGLAYILHPKPAMEKNDVNIARPVPYPTNVWIQVCIQR